MSVAKGRITLLEDPERIDYRQFLYNPNTMNDSRSVTWGEAQVPGASHPVVQFGAGGARQIKFELYMDAIRLKIVRNGYADLNEEIRWYRSLTYPTAYKSATSKVSPPRVSLTFGTLWDGVVCVTRKCDVKITQFSAVLTPIIATVSLELQEVVTSSQIYSDVLIKDPNTPVSGPKGPWTSTPNGFI